MTQPDHPQTARVFVNRLWYLFFGRGLSKILDDTGSQVDIYKMNKYVRSNQSTCFNQKPVVEVGDGSETAVLSKRVATTLTAPTGFACGEAPTESRPVVESAALLGVGHDRVGIE